MAIDPVALSFLRDMNEATQLAACLEALDIVVVSSNPDHVKVSYTKLLLQRVRLVNLAQEKRITTDTTGPVREPISKALLAAFVALHEATENASVFIERFSSIKNGGISSESADDNEARIAMATTRTKARERGLVAPFQSLTLPDSASLTFENCAAIYGPSLKDYNSDWTISRWTVHDAVAFSCAVNAIAGVIDTLVSAVEDATANDVVPMPTLMPLGKNLDVMFSHGFDEVDKPAALNPEFETLPPILPNQNLCKACNAISLQMLLNGFRHALDYGQAVHTQASCHFCANLISAYDSLVCSFRVRTACDKKHRGRLSWTVEEANGSKLVGIFKLGADHFGKRLYISTVQGSSLFQRGIVPRIDVQAADSPRNLRLLREWLHDCCQSHSECTRGAYSGQVFYDVLRTDFLPFRVIDVGPGSADSSNLSRLVKTRHQNRGRYLALSHCWGKEPPTKTTKATVEAWHTALPENGLTKTIQDAIRLTRDLGERYLWVDSLCIVQDDPVDLSEQIQQMGAIFEGAYCTIAAVDAKGEQASFPDRGLFMSRRVVESPACVRFWLPEQQEQVEKKSDGGSPSRLDGSENVHEIALEEDDRIDRHLLRLSNKFWNKRGWVYQEKMLSRRCIFFTDKRVMWRCSRFWADEQTSEPQFRQPYLMSEIVEKDVGSPTRETDHPLRRLWETSVVNYSKTFLSFVSDKSNALQGVQERLASRCVATFRCGLLCSGPPQVFLSQLLWLSASPVARSLRGHSEFTCPSWSWMNIDGSVIWAANNLNYPPDTLASVTISSSRDSELYNNKDDERKSILWLSGTSRSIRLGPPLSHLPSFAGGQSWPYEYHFGMDELTFFNESTNFLLSSSTSDEMIGWVMLDTNERKPDDGMLAIPLLMYLRGDDEEEPMCVDFLVVSKSPQPNAGTFYRIGRGRVLKGAYSWLEGCGPCGIKLE